MGFEELSEKLDDSQYYKNLYLLQQLATKADLEQLSLNQKLEQPIQQLQRLSDQVIHLENILPRLSLDRLRTYYRLWEKSQICSPWYDPTMYDGMFQNEIPVPLNSDNEDELLDELL